MHMQQMQLLNKIGLIMTQRTAPENIVLLKEHVQSELRVNLSKTPMARYVQICPMKLKIQQVKINAIWMK